MNRPDSKDQYYNFRGPSLFVTMATLNHGKVNGIETVSNIVVAVDHSRLLPSSLRRAKRIASEKLSAAKIDSKKWVEDRKPVIPKWAERMWAKANRIVTRPISDEPCILDPEQPCTGSDPLLCANCSYSPDHVDTGATLRGQPFIAPFEIRVRSEEQVMGLSEEEYYLRELVDR